MPDPVSDPATKLGVHLTDPVVRAGSGTARRDLLEVAWEGGQQVATSSSGKLGAAKEAASPIAPLVEEKPVQVGLGGRSGY